MSSLGQWDKQYLSVHTGKIKGCHMKFGTVIQYCMIYVCLVLMGLQISLKSVLVSNICLICLVVPSKYTAKCSINR